MLGHAISSLGRSLRQGGLGVERYFSFTYSALRQIFVPAIDFKLLIAQMEFIGVRSFAIIVLAAIMVGGVFGIQFGNIFRTFGVESLIGAAAAFALSKELAPVLGAFLVTGRAGSAMAAEIANMKINEQLDAMRVMSVNPIGYLASPRVLASILMVPLLSGFFVIVGVFSAFVVGVLLFDIDVGVFQERIQWINKPKDVIEGLQKAAIFGAIYSSICCYKGFQASGGARGVGRATTDAVVISLVVILVSDYFLSYLQMRRIF